MFFFQGSRGRRLLGFLHLPANVSSHAAAKNASAAAPDSAPVGIVFCHSFGEEKMSSHAISVKTARCLCEQGAAVLRFDFSGTGDSEGELDETTLDDWREDLALAVAELRRLSGATKIGLWGLRLGAHLALRYAAEMPTDIVTSGDVAFLILWQPVPDTEVFFKQFLRQKLSTEIAAAREGGPSLKGMIQTLEDGGAVEVIGYPVSKEMFRGFAAGARQPLPSPAGYPVLVTSTSLSEDAAPGSRKIADALSSLGHTVRLEHTREETFWDRLWRWNSPELTRITAEFVLAAISGSAGSVATTSTTTRTENSATANSAAAAPASAKTGPASP